MKISSSYAKIFGETNFQPLECPRSGSKAKDGEKKPPGPKKKKREREREKERKLVITMAKLRMAHANTHGAHKHTWCTQAAWAKILFYLYSDLNTFFRMKI